MSDQEVMNATEAAGPDSFGDPAGNRRESGALHQPRHQPGRYRTIVADPPWAYEEGFATESRTPGKWTGPTRRYALPYLSMTIEEICALPVRSLADRNARLFLWTTNRYLPRAFDVLAAWGFAYRQTLVWHKRDGLSGSIGPNAEFLLVAVRGAPGATGRLKSVVVTASQTKEHSRKPDVFTDLIESVSPGPYVELFARRHRLGWDVWGNESANTAQLVVDEAAS